jgi:iron complex transport system ATP-binding protein
MQNQTPTITGFEAVMSSFYSSIGVHEHQKYSEFHRLTTLGAFMRLGISSLIQKPLCEMSTGEMRKCIIARALAHEPKALLLDEPTVGLDIRAQIDFINMLRSIAGEKTIILITHHIEEIFPEIKKVVLLKDSKIYKQGNKEDILNTVNLSHTFGIDLELGFSNGRYFIKNAS